MKREDKTMDLKGRHFLTLKDFTPEEIIYLLDLAAELKEKKKNGPVYPSVAYELGAQISERTGQEIRVTVPGHMQRGGEPCPYDRVIATRLGAEAAEMIRRKEYGYMVALNNNKIEKIPLADIAGKLKMVDPKSDIIREAKDVGISFGDE